MFKIGVMLDNTVNIPKPIHGLVKSAMTQGFLLKKSCQNAFYEKNKKIQCFCLEEFYFVNILTTTVETFKPDIAVS